MRVAWIATPGAATEEERALAWLRDSDIGDVRVIAPDALTREALAGVGAAWIHAGTSTPTLPSSAGRALDSYVSEGGGLLLTMLATPLVVPLGLEQSPPNAVVSRTWDGDTDPLRPGPPGDWAGSAQVRGLQGWGQHPLFDGFVRGTYTWRATRGEGVREATYVRPRWPVAGRVVAVERGHQQLNAEKAVAWEYAVGAGRVMCIGAHLHFAAADQSLAPQRDRLVRNALALFRRRSAREPAWWPHPYVEHAPLDAAETPVAAFGAALPDIGSAITLTSVSTLDDPFTIAGRRAFVAGGERSGPSQVWIHPLCVFSGGMALRVDEEVPAVRSVEVAPEQLVRHLQTRTRYVEERVFVPLNEPSVVFEYRYRRLGKARADLEPPMLDLRLALPLRLEWPMPADALHPLRVTRRTERGTTAIMVVGADERFRSLVCVEGHAEIADMATRDVPRITVHASLAEPLRVTFHASVSGVRSLARAARALARGGVRSFALRRAEWAATLQDEHLALRSPLAALDTAMEWAKVRLASFVASSPSLGTGLMAGYAEARSEWGESRPGNAWFSGRDACWSGFALLGAGMFSEALTAIEFLAATLDVTGKVAREVTTSGVADYDAADTTPLFLRLVAKYALWTGDLERVRALWPEVERALELMFATDRDGDGLPESSGSGEGWIETGALGRGSLSSYVAACWIAALDALVPVARHLGEEGTAVRCHDASTAARRAMDRELFDDATARHALQRLPDGTLVTTLTALAAVPVALGVVGETRGEAVLTGLETDRFTTAWGLRLAAGDDPSHDPAGYHAGAVWPLFTGLMALAEFAQHRQEEGYRYLLANAMLCYDRAKGAFDEVLHGTERRGAGVCPDQASSAAMVISPLIDGMLGAAPDAPARQLRLTPHWPREWTRAVVSNLRVGETTLQLHATEGCLVDGVPHDGVRYALTAHPPGSVTLILEHPVEGRSVERVLLDGVEIEAERVGIPACPHVRVTIESVTTLELQFVGRAIVEG
jgi:glycogen debranching enzyme